MLTNFPIIPYSRYILPIQFNASKLIANQAIYANRQWYSIHSIFIEHVYNKIILDTVKVLSTNYKYKFLEMAFEKKHLYTIGTILSYIRLGELIKFNDLQQKIFETFSNQENDIIMGGICGLLTYFFIISNVIKDNK